MVATTLAVALLVENRELGLDMYARKFFGLRFTGDRILGHRSGLPAWGLFGGL